MRIAQIIPNSSVYGPGNRFVLWLQGCSLHCEGCWNKSMWEFNAGTQQNTNDILHQVLTTPDIEGITLLGGEPLDQYEETLQLAKSIQEKGLSVMLFTGYEWSELADLQMTEILDYTDILVTGRYIKNCRNTHLQWIGSDNQEIRFLTPRYQNHQTQNANYTEIHFDAFGEITIVGFPNHKDLKTLLAP